MRTNTPAMKTMPYFHASFRKVSENWAWEQGYLELKDTVVVVSTEHTTIVWYGSKTRRNSVVYHGIVFVNRHTAFVSVQYQQSLSQKLQKPQRKHHFCLQKQSLGNAAGIRIYKPLGHCHSVLTKLGRYATAFEFINRIYPQTHCIFTC